MTNFEKIKNMSIDEMANSDFFKCPFGESRYLFCQQYECDCYECIKAWLESGVKFNYDD